MHASAFLREFVPAQDGTSAALPAPDEIRVRNAYEQGIEDGMARARTEIEGETLLAVGELTRKLEALSEDRQRIVAETSAEAGVMLSTVIRTLCPALAALGVAERAQQLLENALRDAPQPLTVSVAPVVAARLESLLSEVPGPEFSIEPMPDMPVTRAEIAWPEGGATIDGDAIAARILGLAAELDPHTASVEENPHD